MGPAPGQLAPSLLAEASAPQLAEALGARKASITVLSNMIVYKEPTHETLKNTLWNKVNRLCIRPILRRFFH